MDLYLSKGIKKRKVKAGPALYLLLGFIPFIGGLIQLILTIVYKQFKGIILNSFLIVSASSMVYIIVELFANSLGSLGIIINILGVLGFLGFLIYFYILLIINSNCYSLQQYLNDGYIIDNEENLPSNIKIWIETSKSKKKPFFLLLNF
ncbi:MAG: hypothetical protein ACK5HR_05975 [Mycoplasmatales bacterium]